MPISLKDSCDSFQVLALYTLQKFGSLNMFNIEVGFGFGVELFVIFFSFLCWLFYVPSNNSSVSTENEINSNYVDESEKTQNNKEEDSESNYLQSDALNKQDCTLTIDNLKFDETQKVASILQENNILPLDLKLSGRGKNKLWIGRKIKKLLPLHTASVKKAIEEVLEAQKT